MIGSINKFSVHLKLLQLSLILSFCIQGSGGTFQMTASLLVDGSKINKELTGGEAQVFQVQLMSGQFLHVEVEQKNVDVALTLIGPDGKVITTINGPNSLLGAKPIVAIAQIEGEYRLEVTSLDKKAPIGRYELRVLALREATLADQNHVKAERAFEEARQLHRKRTSDSWQAAIEKYQFALQFFQSKGDQYRLGLTLYSIGFCYANLGGFEKMLDFAKQSLPHFRVAEERSMEASALNLIGGAYDVLGEPLAALTHYEQALVLTRITGNRNTEANILNNIGKINFDMSNWQKALEYWDLALPIFHDAGESLKEGNTLHNIGTTHARMGDYEKAMVNLERSLVLRRSSNDKNGEADTLGSLGNVCANQDDHQKALGIYKKALELQQNVNNRRGEGHTLNFIGESYLALGEYEKAFANFEQSLKLVQTAGDRRSEAKALSNKGLTYKLLNQSQKAIESLNQALAIFQAIGDQQNEATTLQRLASTDRDGGNLEVARQRIDAALKLYENVRTNVDSQQSRASYFAVQQKAYQFYTDLLMQLHQQNPSAGHDAAALQIMERARARSLLELIAESKVDFRQGVETKLLDRERELLLRINAKAARLMQRNSADKIAQLKKEISALEDDYQQAQTAIRKSNPQYANVTQPQPLSVPAIQQELDENTLLLEYALGEERSFVWAVTNNSLTSYELPKQSEIKPVAQQVYEALTARTLVINGETPSTKQARIMQADAQFTEASTKLSQMLLAPLASQLGNKRLVIVADGALQYVPFGALPECGLGIGDCGLAAAAPSEKITTGRIVPHSAIPNPKSAIPLILNHEIISLPSASVIGVMRKELAGRTVAPKMLAVIADPVFTADDERAKISKVKLAKAGANETAARGIVHEDAKSSGDQKMSGGLKIPRLPYTHQEADQIFALAPKASSFRATDFKASRATVTDPELGKYRYLHFATHGLLDSEKPGLSSLVLSMLDEQGQPQDGFFRAHELYNLKLPAELVVLSACQTGLGKEIKGEGLVGLTRGFMYAGAARVIVSLWSVNDKATAELMTKLYQSMLQKGESPAAALRSAQVAMWKNKQWNAPYYWAAFTLQGEWK